ncbi:MAG: DUF2306 domain-containing protein [Polyangiaceae bacterium]
MAGWLVVWAKRGFGGLMWAGAALIAASSLDYFDLETLPPFVVEKLPLRFETLWLLALRVHVASALASFPLCLLLMTRWLQRRAAWHRWLGRLSGSLILLALVPSGFTLAFTAKGGALGTLGFLLSGALVAGFTSSGVLSARRRDFLAHRRAMLHVVGQMSVAVVSRGLMLGLDAFAVDPDKAYVIALWCPVLTSVFAVELASKLRLSPRIPMKFWHFLGTCVLALCCVPSHALGDEATQNDWLRNRVENGLLKPLAQRETRRFSRERPLPRQRRVRALSSSPSRDARGREFIGFAVDVRFADWMKDDIVGCAYPASGELYVKLGDSYYAAAMLLGKRSSPVAGVCQEATRARS